MGKQRYMVGRARGTVLTATRLILRRDGLRGLYRGFLLTFATYGPFSAIYFWSYDQFTRFMGQYPLINGTLAGAVAGVATQPVDWLKTRVQVSYNCVQSIIPQSISPCPLATFTRLGSSRYLNHLHPRWPWSSIGRAYRKQFRAQCCFR